jgi:hypothetical protein
MPDSRLSPSCDKRSWRGLVLLSSWVSALVSERVLSGKISFGMILRDKMGSVDLKFVGRYSEFCEEQPVNAVNRFSPG